MRYNEYHIRIRNSFKNALKESVKYVFSSWFLIYSIITSIAVACGAIDLLLNLLSSQAYGMGVPLVLALIGIFTAKYDIKKLRQNSPKTSKILLQIMVGGFLIISSMNDVIYFEIDTWSFYIEKFATPEQQDELQLRFDQAQMADLVGFFMYPIFFHGNRIWNWIREQEKIIDEIEVKMILPEIQSKV